MFTYLSLNLLTIFVPLIRSFEPRIRYFHKWPYLLVAIILTGAFFIVWDVYFTKWGVWSFNHDYVIGTFFLGLPIEEWLFFLTVPFACVFIYEVLKYFIQKDWLGAYARPFSILLAIILLIVAFLSFDKLYTCLAFSLTAGLLLLHAFVLKVRYLGYFYLAYLISLIPFVLVNGVLTAWPVVSYNNAENLGIRLGSIPLEDTMYCLLLLLMNITIYEFLLERFFYPKYEQQNQ